MRLAVAMVTLGAPQARVLQRDILVFRMKPDLPGEVSLLLKFSFSPCTLLRQGLPALLCSWRCAADTCHLKLVSMEGGRWERFREPPRARMSGARSPQSSGLPPAWTFWCSTDRRGTARMGGEFGGEQTPVHVWLRPLAAHLK